jgi:hypothetical protein
VTLTVGSMWVDTKATTPPATILARTVFTDATWRRTVEVRAVYLGATVTSRWQQLLPDMPHSVGGWVTITTRDHYASEASFGRRYQPLEES